MTKKLTVLIVEDDENDCKALAKEVNANADKLCLAGVLKSSNDALVFIRNQKPNAVILDLELQEGSGDGMDLLDKLRSVVLSPKPYIVVNTNSASKVTRNSTKKLGADYEFAKWQKGYSPKMVIDHLLRVMPEILGYEEEPPALPSEQQLENKMRDFVQAEFNKLGVSVKNVGYNYLVDAVILATNGENQNWGKIIGKKFGKNENGVMHAMQYAINNTWNNADINNLQKYYTAPLRKDKYVPTITEFVFYYKQKLISYLNK
ncbi:MAG: response regulator [Clostridia bacterium]|nr:response regulator [Clostridia bacterium]